MYLIWNGSFSYEKKLQSGHDHYDDVKMSALASQITSLTVVYSTVYLSADQRKHQSFASLAFVRGLHRGPVNSPHKWPVTRKMFPFDNVIIDSYYRPQNKVTSTPLRLRWTVVWWHIHIDMQRCIFLFLDYRVAMLKWLKSFRNKYKSPFPFILIGQYHGCWWPDDMRRKVVNNHRNEIVIREYPVLNNRIAEISYD